MFGRVLGELDSGKGTASFVVVALAVLLLPVKSNLSSQQNRSECGLCPRREGGRRVSVLVCPRPTCPFELKVAVLCVLTVAV